MDMSDELRVAHCPICGKIFQKNLRNQCTNCSTEEDEQLRSIEQALNRNRRLNNVELAAATLIPEVKIRSFIRLGKLRLYEYPELADNCDSCSEPIRRGTICSKCSTRIKADIANAIEQERLLKERIKLKTYIVRAH